MDKETRLSPTRWAAALVLLASLAGLLTVGGGSMASAEPVPGCEVLEAGPRGPEGDVLLVRAGSSTGIVLYRYLREIRVFDTWAAFETVRWRKNSTPLACEGGRATVDNIDRIVIRVSPSWEEGLVIDQSGQGIRMGKPRETMLVGPGGPFSPGASGNGIAIRMKGQPETKRYDAPLVFAGSSRDDAVRVGRKGEGIELRTGLRGSPDQALLNGFNARDVLVWPGAGDDLVSGRGIEEERGVPSVTMWIWGGAGNDRLFGHHGHDILIRGGRGDDYLWGGDGDDGDTGSGYGLLGDSGADTIYAGNGSDDIEGGIGRDHVNAGGGPDSVYEKDKGADVVNCGTGRKKDVQVDFGLDRLINCRKGYLE